ncbi:MAG: histidine kinase [Flavobacteriaceae bacterium]|nr:histidine kinase [Flavobacteriaceae bacterium]
MIQCLRLQTRLNPKETIKLILGLCFCISLNAQKLGTNFYTDFEILLEEVYQENLTTSSKIFKLEESFDQLHLENNDSLRLRNQFKIVNRLRYLEVDSLYDDYVEQIYKDAKKTKDTFNIIRSYNYKANQFERYQKIDSAFYYYNKSTSLLQFYNHYFIEIDALIGKAKLYFLISDYNKSLEYVFKSLKNAEINYLESSFFDCISIIIEIYGEVNQINLAEKYYNRGVNHFNKFDKKNKSSHQTQIAQIHNFMGSAYLKNSEYQKALDTYRKAKEIKKLEKKFPALATAVEDNIIYTRYLLGDKVNTVEELKIVLREKEKLNFPTIAIQTKIRLAEILNDLNRNKEAYKFAKEALEQAKELRVVKEQLITLKLLAEIDSSQAFKYLDEYIQLNDSIIAQERVQRDEFARIEFETEQLRRKKVTAELASERANQKLLNLMILGAVLLAIVSVVFGIYRRKLLKTQIEKKEKENELLLQKINTNKLLRNNKLNIQNRIANDLHDKVSTSINANILQLKNFKHIYKNEFSKNSLNDFERRLEGLSDAQKQARAISHQLKNAAITEQKLVQFITEELPLILDKHLVELNIDEKIKWEKLNENQLSTIYIILKELAVNIKVHALAKHVILNISLDKNQLVFSIFDNGKGFDSKLSKEGIGLKSIKERIKSINGTIVINSSEGKGTSVEFKFPIQ